MVYISSDTSLEGIVKELKTNAYEDNLVQTIIFDKGQPIIVPEKTNHSLFIIASGIALSTHSMKGATKSVISFLTKGDIIGLDSFFKKDENLILTNATALNELEVIKIDMEYMLNYLANRPSFMEHLASMMTERIYNLYERYMNLMLGREDRLMVSLDELADKLGTVDTDGTVLPSVINIRLIGAYCNIDRNFMSRQLKKMMEEGKISFDQKRITIRNI